MKSIYKLYYKNDKGDKVYVGDKFEGDDEIAYQKVCEQNKSDPTKTYFWQKVFVNIQLDKNGKEIYRADSPEELMELWKQREVFWETLWFEITWYCYYIWKDYWWSLREAWRRVFHKWDYSMSSDVFGTMLEYLIDVVPNLDKDGWIAPKEFLTDDVDENGVPTLENTKQANAKFKKLVNEFVCDLGELQFYENFGYVDKKDNPIVIEASKRVSIPLYPGSEETDYKKLTEIKTKLKKKIFKFLEKYGEYLQD